MYYPERGNSLAETPLESASKATSEALQKLLNGQVSPEEALKGLPRQTVERICVQGYKDWAQENQAMLAGGALGLVLLGYLIGKAS